MELIVYLNPVNRKYFSIQIISLLISAMAFGSDQLSREFQDPPLKYASRPLWFWNNTEVTEQGITEPMLVFYRLVKNSSLNI